MQYQTFYPYFLSMTKKMRRNHTTFVTQKKNNPAQNNQKNTIVGKKFEETQKASVHTLPVML